MALAAYRQVLRSIGQVFKNDTAVLTQARSQARHTFREHRDLEGGAAAEQIEHATQVAELLRRNVVQGERIESASDSQGKGQGETEERYRLRITPHTELGDNESVKLNFGRRDMGSLAGVEACALPQKGKNEVEKKRRTNRKEGGER